VLVFLSLVIDSKESMWLHSFFLLWFRRKNNWKKSEKVLYSIIEIVEVMG